MLSFLGRRFLYMILLVFLVTVLGFVVIQLPPGDWLSSYIIRVEMSGGSVEKEQVEILRRMYGLERPVYEQYLRWVWGMLQGNFGYSFFWNRPVGQLISERIGYTLMISLSTFVFSYVLAALIGIYSATHQYKAGDYAATVLGFLGMSTPPFLLALILMFFLFKLFNINVVGLFSSEYLDAPWSWARVIDMLKHLPIPIFVVGLAGVASLQRIMRATLLDELRKQYVITARAKGLTERKVLFKYPVRVAINPIVSTMGWMFPQLIGGGAIVAVVLNLPTLGPLLLSSLRGQDMYLAGAIMTMLSILTVVGFFVSDVLLMVADPRIRME
jgi:peptide/nickel transport system permease protein